LSGPRDLACIVSGGEAIGYDYCTMRDHVVIPRDKRNILIPIPANFPAGRPRPERAINLSRVRRGEDIKIAAGDVGDSRASSPAGADGKNPRDN
jgi:hypothetical protein